MDPLKLCPSDFAFMTVIWDHEPVPSGKLVEYCAKELGWKKPTTYTTLKKLCDKGFAKNEQTIVTSIIPRERVQAHASEHFVTETFRGSLPGFLAAFLGDKTISQEEAEELKRLIDAHRECLYGRPSPASRVLQSKTGGVSHREELPASGGRDDLPYAKMIVFLAERSCVPWNLYS